MRDGRRVVVENYVEFIQKMRSFQTKQQFDSIVHSFTKPSNMVFKRDENKEPKYKCDYFVFKSGVKPQWEDEANKHGGKWTIRLPRTHAASWDNCWYQMLLAVILDELPGRNNCGVELNVRGNVARLSLWTSCVETESSPNFAAIRDILHQSGSPTLKVEFHPHVAVVDGRSSSSESDGDAVTAITGSLDPAFRGWRAPAPTACVPVPSYAPAPGERGVQPVGTGRGTGNHRRRAGSVTTGVSGRADAAVWRRAAVVTVEGN